MSKIKLQYIVLIAICIIVISYSVLLIANKDQIDFLCKEDSFFEYGSAFWFLLASITLFHSYKKDKSGNDFKIFKTNRNLFFLLLGLLFFVAFGEEISWGQRILNFETPEYLKSANRQQEFNIHNLKYFSGRGEGQEKATLFLLDRLFEIFWFSYCFLIPLINKLSKKVSNFFNTINLPIVPLSIGILFIANYILSRGIVYFSDCNSIHPVIEVKETNTAFLFFIVAIIFYYTFRKVEKSSSD